MSLRERAAAHDTLLERRLDSVVPELMEQNGFWGWVLAAREYNEDPVLETMLPATWLGNARRRTILAFKDFGRERAAIARYPVGPFPKAWDPETQPEQWLALAQFLGPPEGPVAVNTSRTFALADGLSASEHEQLGHALRGIVLEESDSLAIGWLETRLPEEVQLMRDATALAHSYLRRALSGEVVTPGRTSTHDIAWWLRQMVHEAGLSSWFHPGVTVQRHGAKRVAPSDTAPDVVVQPGDLLHVDFGIVDGIYHTDQQQHAYVLKPGETEAPASFRVGLEHANRLQDLLMEEMSPGITGNEVLSSTRARAEAEGIQPVVYTHPIGLHGHAGGSTIGLWDQQEGVAGSGDYPLGAKTPWSIELAVKISVDEWGGQPGQIMLEEDAFLSDTEIDFLDGRQTELYLVEA